MAYVDVDAYSLMYPQAPGMLAKHKPVRLCKCRCGCGQEAIYGRPPFFCKRCWQEADADPTGPGTHGIGEVKR